MEVNKFSSKEGIKWTCKEHPNVACDFICLDADAKDRVVCFKCTLKHQIPFSNLISMSVVLAAKENEILQAFPPLKDQNLSSKLRNTNPQYQLEEIEVYFKKLQNDFEKQLQAAQQRAKQCLIKQEMIHYELLERYNKIAEVQKLKELIVSDKESAEKDLDDFIKVQWNKAEENRKILADLINQQETEQCFSSDKPNKMFYEIIQSMKSINFFQQSQELLSQITLIKSTFNTSQQMEIIKVDNSIYQIKKQGTDKSWDQVFIDPILNPYQRYILQIQLEQKQTHRGNNFFFGLVKDEGKDNSQAYCQQMAYYDNDHSYGIDKYIKGSSMQSGTKVIGKHSFEVRIYLDQQYLRVASLPDYSSITVLKDPNRIDPKVTYRFFLSMYSSGDMMRITNIRTVSEFDKKM